MRAVMVFLLLAVQGLHAVTPQIALKTDTEEGKKMLVASVTLDGKPVPGATVRFLVEREFGKVTVGQDQTLDDGTAAIPFPITLPGGSTGILRISAEIKDPPQFAASSATSALEGGAKVQPDKEPFPRALWSPTAPLVLVGTIVTILISVWGTYLFVIMQLVKIKQGANQ